MLNQRCAIPRNWETHTMYNLTNAEIILLLDALDMAYKSNKRMQSSKPKFQAVFTEIENEIVALKMKLSTNPTPPTTKQK